MIPGTLAAVLVSRMAVMTPSGTRPASASAFSVSLRIGLRDDNVASHEFLAADFQGFRGVLALYHLNKTVTFRAAAAFIRNHSYAFDLAIGFEQSAQLFICRIEIQISDK